MKQPMTWAEHRYRMALLSYGEPLPEHDGMSTVTVRYGAFSVSLSDCLVDPNWVTLTIRYLTNGTKHTRPVRAGSCQLMVTHEMAQLWRAMVQVKKEMEGAE
jgi:hypothetical protein